MQYKIANKNNRLRVTDGNRMYFIRNWDQVKSKVKEGDEVSGDLINHGKNNMVDFDIKKSFFIRKCNGIKIAGK